MKVDDNLFDELQHYIDEKKYDYALKVIDKSAIGNPLLGEDRKNIWFHYLCGLAYYFDGMPIGAVCHLSGFVNMASDEFQMKVDNRMYGVKIPSLEQIDTAMKMLEDAIPRSRDMISEKPEFQSDPEAVEKQLKKFQNMYCKYKGLRGVGNENTEREWFSNPFVKMAGWFRELHKKS